MRSGHWAVVAGIFANGFLDSGRGEDSLRLGADWADKVFEEADRRSREEYPDFFGEGE